MLMIVVYVISRMRGYPRGTWGGLGAVGSAFVAALEMRFEAGADPETEFKYGPERMRVADLPEGAWLGRCQSS